jgi:hypothetical protein
MLAIALTVLVVTAVIALALALAYLPMKLLVLQIARNVREMIERQRERRQAPRTTRDRRKASEPLSPGQLAPIPDQTT